MKKQIKDVISAEFKGLWGTDFSDDGIPVIKTNNMTYEGRIDYSDICLRNITSEEAEGNFLCNGDLIIEKSGGTKTHSVGYVNIFEGEDNKYVCNNFILPIRPNRGLVNPKYLFWQLHGMYEAGRFSDCFNKTTGIQNLQKKTYFSKEINVPSLPEQQKIAAHLDSIQSAIDNKKQQLQQLDELVKSKFVEMFGVNPVESGKWKVEKLDTLVQVTSSKRIYAEEQTDSGIPFLRISDLVSRINGLEQAELYISYEKYNEFSKKGWVPTKDDILVTTRGTLGLCYIIREDDEFYFQDGMITWLKFDNHEKVLSVFICYLFAYVLSPKFNIKSNGATVKYLSISDLKVEKIPVPPIDLQNDFAAYVQKSDSAKSIIKTQLVDLQELLDSKMDEYFGE
ncbi:MAG: restriction endonuclease subunit S [Treponema sp.]|nr:restriction endonuclease subunit S [Treponema sp.]